MAEQKHIQIRLYHSSEKTDAAEYREQDVFFLQSMYGSRVNVIIEADTLEFSPAVRKSLMDCRGTVVYNYRPDCTDLRQWGACGREGAAFRESYKVDLIFNCILDERMIIREAGSCEAAQIIVKEMAQKLYENSVLPYTITWSSHASEAENNGILLKEQFLLESYRAYRRNPVHNRILTIDKMVEKCMPRKNRSDTQKRGYEIRVWPDGRIHGKNLAEQEAEPILNSYPKLSEEMKRDLREELVCKWKGSTDHLPTLSMNGFVPHPYEMHLQGNRILDAVRHGKQTQKWECAIQEKPLSRLYLTLTYDCPLRCTHCFVDGGVRKSGEMHADRIADIVREAIELHVRDIIFSGGEPLVYAEFDRLLEILDQVNRAGTRFTLRTSLGFPIEEKRLIRLVEFFDKVVVSLDGDEETHDRRRGHGRFQITLNSLHFLSEKGYRSKIGLCSVLSEEEQKGKEGAFIRSISRESGIELQFNQLLPAGRGKKLCDRQFRTAEENLFGKVLTAPHFSCGIGEILDVKPDGSVYPCHTIDTADHFLGNLQDTTLTELLHEEKFQFYRRYSVDTNEQCRQCSVRYLCGGLCMAWHMNTSDLRRSQPQCTYARHYYQQAARKIAEHESDIDDLWKQMLREAHHN